jgi:hypothetical protein
MECLEDRPGNVGRFDVTRAQHMSRRAYNFKLDSQSGLNSKFR